MIQSSKASESMKSSFPTILTLLLNDKKNGEEESEPENNEDDDEDQSDDNSNEQSNLQDQLDDNEENIPPRPKKTPQSESKELPVRLKELLPVQSNLPSIQAPLPRVPASLTAIRPENPAKKISLVTDRVLKPASCLFRVVSPSQTNIQPARPIGLRLTRAPFPPGTIQTRPRLALRLAPMSSSGGTNQIRSVLKLAPTSSQLALAGGKKVTLKLAPLTSTSGGTPTTTTRSVVAIERSASPKISVSPHPPTSSRSGSPQPQDVPASQKLDSDPSAMDTDGEPPAKVCLFFQPSTSSPSSSCDPLNRPMFG